MEKQKNQYQRKGKYIIAQCDKEHEVDQGRYERQKSLVNVVGEAMGLSTIKPTLINKVAAGDKQKRQTTEIGASSAERSGKAETLKLHIDATLTGVKWDI